MSAQPTQGQWAAVPAADGSGQCGVVVDGKFVIAEFFPDIRNRDERADDECKANAMRAAAAPELLAALIRLSGSYERLKPPGYPKSDSEKQADAAIAKAIGAQS